MNSQRWIIYRRKEACNLSKKKKKKQFGQNRRQPTTGLFPLKKPEAMATERGESKKKEGGEIPPPLLSFRVPSTTSSFINRASINIRQNSSRDAWHPIEVMAVGLKRNCTTEYTYVRRLPVFCHRAHVFRMYTYIYVYTHWPNGW